MKLSLFAALVVCGSLAAACQVSVTDADGGSGGASSVNPQVVSSSTGINDCYAAAQTIGAKLQTCGVDNGSATAGSSGTGSASCTVEEGKQQQALASCYAGTTCEAIKGSDPTAAQSLAACLQAAENVGSSTSAATGTPGTTGAGGGGSCDTGEHGSPANTATEAEVAICTSCVQCTQSGACNPQWVAFANDPNQTAFGECLNACVMTDGSCSDACSASYPTTAAAYTSALSCSVCQECPANCDAATICM